MEAGWTLVMSENMLSASRRKKFRLRIYLSLIRKVWKLYNGWPGSQQNSLTFPDHSQGIKIIP